MTMKQKPDYPHIEALERELGITPGSYEQVSDALQAEDKPRSLVYQFFASYGLLLTIGQFVFGLRAGSYAKHCKTHSYSCGWCMAASFIMFALSIAWCMGGLLVLIAMILSPSVGLGLVLLGLFLVFFPGVAILVALNKNPGSIVD